MAGHAPLFLIDVTLTSIIGCNAVATTVTLGWSYAALTLLTALPLTVLAVRRTPR
ncbi:hypothetical protein ACFT8W_05920 [Streptomyces hygroscopicus]|uniref:hypothetical protein n=1 Tax=Streptomyces hygroscopicus TaxID=1912 RepID=UPI00363C62D3